MRSAEDGATMRDGLTEALTRYARMSWPELPGAALDAARDRLIDSVGVAVGAFASDGPTAVRRVAAATPVVGGARVWGTGIRTSLELATLANGAAVRYLDYNDAYFGVDSTHPSDIIAGLVAVAEQHGATGQELLEAIAVGYEVAVTAADGFGARVRGWDHVNGTALGAVCGAGRLMRLSAEQLADAIGIVVVSHAAMGQSREGELSMWKGLAAPDAVQHAVYACRLAEAGVRGPHEPFDGRRGFVNLVLGGAYVDRAAFGRIEQGLPPSRIVDTHIKAWPLGIVAQSGVDAALRIHPRLTGLERIASVEIEAFSVAVEVMGSPEKWRPMTRETADHSMVYVVATALRDGRVDAASFDVERVVDPALHAFLAERVRFTEDPALSEGYPEGFPTRVRVRTTSGDTFEEEVRYFRGHARNPLGPEELAEKFRAVVDPVLGAARASSLLDVLRGIGSAPDVRGIADALEGDVDGV